MITDIEAPPRQYPSAMVNVTNRCTLSCRHCFVLRQANPNDLRNEMTTPRMLEELAQLQRTHGIKSMMWMGGEPLLRPDVLIAGTRLFADNTITTNGTRDLLKIPNCNYVVSIDGPPEINDAIRGEGSFESVMNTLSRLPPDFGSRVMCQCVVTKANEDVLEEFVLRLANTRADGLAFTFYVPRKNDTSDLTWGTLERRDRAVREVMRLKTTYPQTVRNKGRSLELLLSENALAVTNNCRTLMDSLPLYLDGDHFATPFCCYGNDVDCDLCGAWGLFHSAAKREEGRSPNIGTV